MQVMSMNAFPEKFSICMLKTIWHNGKQEKGKMLSVPEDVPRQTAIHWCLRTRPLAEVVMPVEDPPPGGPVDPLKEPPVDSAQGQSGEPVDPPEDPGDPPADPPQEPPGNPEDPPQGGQPPGDEDPPENEDPPIVLEDLSYAELQGLAKEQGIRSVGVSREDLIESLK